MSNKTIELIAAQTAILDRIARALETLAIAQAPAPNFKRPLTDFAAFDWTGINAMVRQRDQQGPTVVEWGGFTWTRRSGGDKKKGNAIWFSRVVSGNVADGNVKWARLITFKNFSEAEPLADSAAAAVKQNGKRSWPATRDGLVKWLDDNTATSDIIAAALGMSANDWLKANSRDYTRCAQLVDAEIVKRATR